MKYEKQVDKSHYDFRNYMGKPRWNSLWHQLDEVIRLNPNRVLEIGPGPGLFKAAAKAFGLDVETLDLDPELQPDHVASATDMPFDDNSFDVVCAFQMLEHLPYETSIAVFKEMSRVTKSNIVISLPDAKRAVRMTLAVPRIGTKYIIMEEAIIPLREHKFDGEHYWEINKKGYSLNRIIRDLSEIAELQNTYRVPENTYHRFFVFKK